MKYFRANLGPADINYDETLSTLRYGKKLIDHKGLLITNISITDMPTEPNKLFAKLLLMKMRMLN